MPITDSDHQRAALDPSRTVAFVVSQAHSAAGDFSGHDRVLREALSEAFNLEPGDVHTARGVEELTGQAAQLASMWDSTMRVVVFCRWTTSLAENGGDDTWLKSLARLPLRQLLVAIDAPSSMDTAEADRDVHRRLDVLAQQHPHMAVLTSTSPGEPSHENSRMGGTVWAHAWATGMRGELAAAIERDGAVTARSLGRAITEEVARYLREDTQVATRQTPRVYASQTALVLQRRGAIPPDGLGTLGGADLGLDLSAMTFRRLDQRAIKRLAGFDKKRGHFIPTDLSHHVDEFVARLLADEVHAEAQLIYERAKRLFGLRRRAIKRTLDQANGALDTDFFRVRWDAHQAPDAPEQFRLLRTFTLRVPPEELPRTFDSLFPVPADELVIPARGDADFDDVMELLEDLAEGRQLGLVEDSRRQRGILTLPSGDTLTIDCAARAMVIETRTRFGCLHLLAHARAELASLVDPVHADRLA